MAIENFIFKQVFVLLFIIEFRRLKGKQEQSLTLVSKAANSKLKAQQVCC